MLALLGLNQLWPKIILIAGVAVLAVALVSAIFTQGKKSAQVDAVVKSMKSLQDAQKRRAQIEATRTEEVRKQLKQRWSQR